MPPINVADLLTRQALATPEQTAVIHEERIFNYAEFEALVSGLSLYFLGSGVQQGAIVGLHLEDTLLHLSALWAMAKIGAVAVAVNANSAAADAAKAVLSRTRATALVTAFGGTDWKFAKTIRLCRDQLAMLAASSHGGPKSCNVLDQNLHFKTSSGTTASPKLVAGTHAGMIASIEREIANVGYLKGERYMTPVSLIFDGPRRRYMACLASGGTAVLPPMSGSLQATVDTINRHDVQHFSCVASQAHALALSLPPQGPCFPRMRFLRLSSGPSDASLHRLLRERVSANVLISYGCTELGPLTVAPPDLVLNCAHTVGRPMQGVTVQIVSATGQQLPPDAEGVIRLRAEGMPQGYCDDPVATAKSFRDGWFYPGDIGKMSEAGLLTHLGRADEMMVMDGINIHPAEIEAVLLSHPAVFEAVAFPVKHWVVNDVPFCAVSLTQGMKVSEQELLQFARSAMGSHSPQRVAVLKAIPRSENGKVQRKILMQVVIAWMKAQQNQISPASQQTGS